MNTDLQHAHFDVAVIGGGINGASSAQHLAAAGYSVLLVEKDDFGSGSSSRSTRYLHCGLRYFETPNPVMDFLLSPNKLRVALRMARNSMEIRGELVKDSRERLRKITMCFPVLRNGPYKPWQFDLAFKILGRFGPKDVPLNYQRISPSDAARRVPFVDAMRDRASLHSVVLFTEYMYDWPERFCVDAALDAERMGATIRNHTFARLGERTENGDWQISLTGANGAQDSVTAGVVLNAAGIWIDDVNATAKPKARKLIYGTKGAHVVVKLPDAFADVGLATVNSIGEPHYVLPSQGGLHHIGPTETPYEGDLDDIHTDAEDRAFLINETNAALPGLNVTDDKVVYTWAGVRPLGYDPDYPKGKRSMEFHDLTADGMPGVIATTAGPIMTHRICAREAVDHVRKLRSPSGSPQAIDYAPQKFPENTNAPPLVEGDPSVRLSDLSFAAASEHAKTLADVLINRTGVAYHHQLTDDHIAKAAAAVAAELGWDGDEQKKQATAFRDQLTRQFTSN